jgi:hypothetical protein
MSSKRWPGLRLLASAVETLGQFGHFRTFSDTAHLAALAPVAAPTRVRIHL